MDSQIVCSWLNGTLGSGSFLLYRVHKVSAAMLFVGAIVLNCAHHSMVPTIYYRNLMELRFTHTFTSFSSGECIGTDDKT